jgi:hypothetical protein
MPVLPFLVALLAQTPSYDLQWRPTAGRKLEYALKFDTTVATNPVTFTATLRIEVKGVEKNGDYTLATTVVDSKMVVDGSEQTIDDGETPKPDIEKFNARGDRIGAKDEDDGDVFSAVLSDLMDFESPATPVHVGEKWARQVKDDPKTKSRAARLDYTLAAIGNLGKRKVVRLDYHYARSQGDPKVTGDGSIWLDSEDFTLVKLDVNVHGLQVAPDQPPADAHVTILRK